ncbi:arylsulfatase I-like [Haemaphysalis longicornis]
MTGLYPYRLGMQGHGLRHLEPTGLPLGVTTIAEELKRLNYSTHAFGKWHLGYCDWSLTPTRRGFDDFRGFYAGSQDYFEHTSPASKKTQARWYDFRNGTRVDYSARSVYSTTLIANEALRAIEKNSRRNQPMFLYVAFQAIHAPLQAPKVNAGKCSGHTNELRKRICCT